MCGIAGWIGPVEAVPGPARLEAMTEAILHRGPDDGGGELLQSRDGRWQAALGNRRLAIVDPAGGHQPMRSADGRLAVTCNGEIYNFRNLRAELRAAGHAFRTGCDTEVLLHGFRAWGEGLVERLRGMFAFALWDAETERLLLARDAFGKKPLYLAHRGDLTLFASEAKALFASGAVAPELNGDILADYLAYRYAPGPQTLFRGVAKLPPGSYAVWQAGSWTERRWYVPPDGRVRSKEERPADPAGAFLAHLDDAVTVRLMSDVPFGAFLSGGIDSSAVVALMARRLTGKVRTFSVGFPEAAYSELKHAAAVARQVGAEHHELSVEPDDLMRHLPALVRFRDAPVAEPSDIPIHLLALEAARTVKMVLTGEGGDEVLAGYPKHVLEPYGRLYRLLPARLRHRLTGPLIDALPYRHRRARTAAAALDLEEETARFPRWFGALGPDELAGLMREPPATTQRADMPPFDAAPRLSALRRLLYFDQTSWLPDNLLERGDRMTMAASLEARMPFLDTALAQFVASLPDRFRVRGRTTKWLLRQAMTRLLPREIVERPKVGFRVPVNEWFRGPMREYLRDHLTGPGSRTRDHYRPEVLERVLREHEGEQVNHEKLLWTLLSLELFHRECLP